MPIALGSTLSDGWKGNRSGPARVRVRPFQASGLASKATPQGKVSVSVTDFDPRLKTSRRA